MKIIKNYACNNNVVVQLVYSLYIVRMVHHHLFILYVYMQPLEHLLKKPAHSLI